MLLRLKPSMNPLKPKLTTTLLLPMLRMLKMPTTLLGPMSKLLRKSLTMPTIDFSKLMLPLSMQEMQLVLPPKLTMMLKPTLMLLMLHLLLLNILLKMLMPLLPKLASNSMLPRQASELLNSATLKPLTLFMLPKLPSKHLTRLLPLPMPKELLQLISSKENQLMSLTDA